MPVGEVAVVGVDAHGGADTGPAVRWRRRSARAADAGVAGAGAAARAGSTAIATVHQHGHVVVVVAVMVGNCRGARGWWCAARARRVVRGRTAATEGHAAPRVWRRLLRRLRICGRARLRAAHLPLAGRPHKRRTGTPFPTPPARCTRAAAAARATRSRAPRAGPSRCDAGAGAAARAAGTLARTGQRRSELARPHRQPRLRHLDARRTALPENEHAGHHLRLVLEVPVRQLVCSVGVRREPRSSNDAADTPRRAGLLEHAVEEQRGGVVCDRVAHTRDAEQRGLRENRTQHLPPPPAVAPPIFRRDHAAPKPGHDWRGAAALLEEGVTVQRQRLAIHDRTDNVDVNLLQSAHALADARRREGAQPPLGGVLRALQQRELGAHERHEPSTFLSKAIIHLRGRQPAHQLACSLVEDNHHNIKHRAAPLLFATLCGALLHGLLAAPLSLLRRRGRVARRNALGRNASTESRASPPRRESRRRRLHVGESRRRLRVGEYVVGSGGNHLDIKACRARGLRGGRGGERLEQRQEPVGDELVTSSIEHVLGHMLRSGHRISSKHLVQHVLDLCRRLAAPLSPCCGLRSVRAKTPQSRLAIPHPRHALGRAGALQLPQLVQCGVHLVLGEVALVRHVAILDCEPQQLSNPLRRQVTRHAGRVIPALLLIVKCGGVALGPEQQRLGQCSHLISRCLVGHACQAALDSAQRSQGCARSAQRSQTASDRPKRGYFR
mmetsp:Transcript_40272/g.121836  ORF Transcript_40272/g.121836 Transcript_40272/m.121836 type:complete len:726 (+) Transcript_40272:742-2919(+)